MSTNITDRAAQVLQQIDAALVNPLPLTKYGRDARKGWLCLKTAKRIVRIAKQRDGERGQALPLEWHGSTTCFHDTTKPNPLQ